MAFVLTRPTLAVARYSQAIVNLLKYAVHGRGATKPTAPVPLLALKPTLVLCLACTVLYCCTVAMCCYSCTCSIEGVGPLIFTEHARSFRNLIIEGESLACQLHFRSARKTEKNASAQGSLKSRNMSNSFWEGTRREKTSLKKVRELVSLLVSQLVSQNKMYTFTCSCIVLSTSFQKFNLCI